MTDSRSTTGDQLYPMLRHQDGRSDHQTKRRADTPQPSFLRRLLNVWLRPPGAPILRPRSPPPPPAQDDIKQRPVSKKQLVSNSTKSRRETRSISFNERGAVVQLLQQKRNWTNGSQTLPHRPKPTAAGSDAVAIVPFSTVIAGGTTCSASCCLITTSTRRRHGHVSATNKPFNNMMPARSTPNLMPNKINVGNQQHQHNAVSHQQGQIQRLQRVASSKKPTVNVVTNQHQHPAQAQMEQQQQLHQQTLYNAYLGHVKNIPPPLPPTLSRDVSTAFGGGGGGLRRGGDDESPPPTPPVRDSSSLKSVKYGPGHEKFPSWPVPATADTPAALRTPPGGGSHRSKSWTDHTNYPKEQPLTYTRPYMKRQHSSQTQQKLKTVLEKCEKIPAEVYDSSKSSHRYHNITDGHGPMIAERGPKYTAAQRDRDYKIPGDLHYTVPSPPERDLSNTANTAVNSIGAENTNMGQNYSVANAYRDKSPTKPQSPLPPLSPLSPPLPISPYNQPNQQQLAPSYATSISANSNYEDTYSHSVLSSYNGTDSENNMHIDGLAGVDDDDSVTLRSGTRGMGGDMDNGGLNSLLLLSAMSHQKQVSYAQSEGYHSYVSSTDSTGTPFLDRLRRDSEATPTSSSAPTNVLHHPSSLLSTSHQTSMNNSSTGHRNDYRDLSNGTISRCSTTMSRSASVVGAGGGSNGGGGRDSVVTTSSGSASSSETLKWHGSMSDVSSIAGSFTTNHSTTSSTPSSTNCSSTSPSAINQHQHRSHNIAHSARVKTPQRHHSESVLYIQAQANQQQQQQQKLPGGANGQQQEQPFGGLVEQQQWRERELRNNGRNNRELKLFAVNTYTVEERDVEKERREVGEMVQQVGTTVGQHARLPSNLDSPPTTTCCTATSTTVADRVNEFEKQQRYSYLDPDKRHKVPDPTLKAIQKKALLSFYERRHSASNRSNSKTNTNGNSLNGTETNGSSSNNWRSEPQLNGAVLSSVATFTVPTLPARKMVQLPSRRASSASDYSKRSSLASLNMGKESGHQVHSPTSRKQSPPPTHHSSKHSPNPLTKSPSKRSSLSDNLPSSGNKLTIKHQHSSSCGSLSTDLLGPVILGPSISLDDWVPEQPPERPPKNPALRNAYLTSTTVAKQSDDSFSANQLTHGHLAVHSQSSAKSINTLETINNLSQVSNPGQTTVLANSSSISRLNPQRFEGVSPLSEDDDLILPPPPPISDLEDDLDSDLPLPPPPSDLLETELVFNGEQSCGAVAGAQVESAKKTGVGNDCANTRANGESALINQTIGLPEPPYFLPPRTGKINSPVRDSPCNFTSSSNIRQRYSAPSQKPPQSAILTTPINCQPLNLASATTMYNCTSDLTVPNRKMKQTTEQYKDFVAKSDSSTVLRSPTDHVARQSSMQRASIAITTGFDCDHHSIEPVSLNVSPPPLQPRQMRVNQSMRARISEQKLIGAGRASPKSKRNSTKDSGTGKGQGNYATMTPSKASYLASRRDRERIVPDSDTGVYKRTISPNGQVISSDTFNESPKMINTRETHWPNSNRIPKDAPATVNHKNHVNILRRVSMSEKANSKTTKGGHIECLEAVDQIKPQLALPDVLPVNAKLLGPRLMSRPSQLSLVPSENDLLQLSPIATPPSSPPRQSLFTPLRNTSLSTTQPLRTPSIRASPPSANKIYSSTYEQADKRSSPPQIRPPLSPNSAKKLSPITRLSPNVPVKVTTPIIMPSSPKRTPSTRSSLESNSPKSLTPPDSPSMNSPKVVEGLQLIQRTEVVLRVNTTTTDAASQTEKVDGDGVVGVVNSTSVGTSPTPVPTRKKLKEEIECEQLSQEFVQELMMPTCDRLKGLLVPGPEHKKSTDYVSGLYRVDVTLRPRPANSPFRSKATTPSNSPPPNNSATCTSISTATQATNHNNSESSSAVPTHLESVSPLSASSAYFTTSEPKAKLLTRYSHDLNQYNVIKNTKDLSQKKEELVGRLDRKLSVLRCEHLVLQEECRINDALGEEVRAHVCAVARPHEAAKVRLHVDEVGRITSLLLGLSGRLARAENALMRLTDGHEEKVILLTKRDKLREQLEEAKQLKGCIDKRAVNVSNILYKYLTADEYADYDHYINMKAKLIMDAKEIADNIQLGEEQLLALQETLIVAE